MDIIAKVKQHPVEAGAIIFVAGFVALYAIKALSGGGQAASSSANNGNLEAAFLAAQSAQAQSGNQLAAVQDQDQAATAQTLIGANASVINNQTWAAAQEQGNTTNVQIAGIQANAATQIAPYAVANNLITALGTTASLPGSTVTSTSTDNGFFGLGASSSSNTSYVANPSAVAASGTLASLAGNLSSGGAFQTGNYTAH